MKNRYAFLHLCITLSLLIMGNTSANAQDNKALIQAALQSEKSKQGWQESDISEWKLSSQYNDESTGITHAYVQQVHNGIPVYNAISVFAVKQNSVVYFKPGLVSHVKVKANSDKSSVTPISALQAAARHLELPSTSQAKLVKSDASANLFEFNAPDLSKNPIKIQLVYLTKNNKLVLAWDVSIELKDGKHWWNVKIDALTGVYLDKNDFVRECNFGENEADNTWLNQETMPLLSNPQPTLPGMPPAVPIYNVFPFPVEAPNFGSRSLLVNPANPLASPFGWHDTDGITGAEHTNTNGNNVFAYEDGNNDNAPGYSPDGGINLNFDFPMNTSQPPATNMDAALTNLFYTVNSVHDRLYALGFDEAAGNFQANNYGHGGSANDPVLAEGFDGGGFNNANFSTPSDGFSGRMQMYLWSGMDCSTLTITSTGYNGPMTTLKAAFSPVANVTADVILMNDGIGLPSDGCSSAINVLTGKIVLIDRGSCSFASKVMAAQLSGAIGVIIANNNALPIFAMGSDGINFPTIPAAMISQADGLTLKAQLSAGVVTANLVTCSGPDLDGSLDNGIIAHEFGHGVSNRLTGGPANSGCLNNGEQAGEGWSDWLALVMTIDPTDQGTDARGIGTYVFNGGIRRYPYSTNMSVNPQTYGDLALSPEVHDIGEIWCSAVWDMTWLLIDQFGYNADPSVATAGNNIAIKLVLEGMKLQPCGPGFLDSRDAILLADNLLYNDAHRCLIGQAFARRGMGSNASQGSADIAGDETEDFTDAFCVVCAGTPVAGTTNSTATEVCALNDFTLKLAGASSGLGLTYQWQSSPDNSTWANIGGATTIQYTGTQTESNWYQCIVTCTSSGLSVASPAVFIGFLANCVLMSNTTVTDCSANFFDTGGPSASYSDFEDNTQTLMPDPGNKIQLTWDYFESEQDFDYITIFDGPDATYPVLYGPVSGLLSIPTFTSTDPSGALTIHFTSDESVTKGGWKATLSCISLCTGPVNSGVSNPVICEGSSVTLNVSGSGGYNWSPAYGLNQTTGSSVIASPATTTTYTVTSTDNVICHIDITVTVNPKPAAAGIVSGPEKVCLNQSGFIYSVDAIANASSYVWTLPVGMSPVSGGLTTASNSITVKTNSSFSTGFIKVNGINDCGSGTLSPGFAVSKYTSVPSKPAKINNLEETVYGYCAGSTYTFTTTSANAQTFTWTASAGTIQSGQGTNTVTIQLNNPYSSCVITVTASNCLGTSQARKLTLKSVLPKPELSGSSEVCKNGNSTKIYSVSCEAGASSFTWSSPTAAIKFSDGGTPANPLTTASTSVSINFSGVATGNHSLRVTANNSCGSSEPVSKTVKVKNCNKTSETEASDVTNTRFNVFPNPTHDMITVSFASDVAGKYSYRLMDMHGKLVISEESNAAEGENEFKVHLSNLAPGTYLLVVQNGETIIRTRIVKE